MSFLDTTVPALCVMDPASVHSQPVMTNPTKKDWWRVRKFLRGEWPRPFPPMYRWEEENEEAVGHWLRQDHEYVVIDGEWNRYSKVLAMVGLYSPQAGVLQWSPNARDSERKDYVAYALKNLVKRVDVVFHNAMADIPVLRDSLGIQYHHYRRVDDTMLAHSALWSEMPHDLEFLDSLYGRHNKLKHLDGKDPWKYNAGDVVSTGYVWEALRHEMDQDRPTRRVYETYLLPLIPVRLDAQRRGIAVDRAGVEREKAVLEGYRDAATHIATAYCGFPINLGSPTQLVQWFNDIEGISLKSVGQDILASERKKHGPANDPDEYFTPDVALRRCAEGAHPLIEARVLYGGVAQVVNHYLKPFAEAEGGRVYPEFKVHAQANARWSTTNPPLAQLPKELQHLLVPDEGWPWWGFDWKQIELRLLAALANDKLLLEGFANEWDLHTVNMCHFLGYELPPDLKKPYEAESCAAWREKYKLHSGDDDRRRVAKILVFRLAYGGDPRFAGGIPGAARLGLDGPGLVTASDRWKRAHPEVVRLWRRIERYVEKTGEIRTFHGRVRKLLSNDVKGRTREAYNYPMQGAVSDILNSTVIESFNAFPGDVRLVYTVHDAATFAIREERYDEITPVLKEIAEREWDVDGVLVKFPVDLKPKREWKE